MYRYDLSGKLVHSYVYDNESMRTVNGVKLRYDDESRLTEESFSYDYNHVGGSATDNYSYLYEYHETMGNVDRMQIFGVGVEGNLYYNYDLFERLTSKSIEFTADGLYAFYNEIGYDFVDNSDDENINHINESILVSQYTSTVKTHAEATSGVTTTYNYTYDELGNITQIADGNGVVQNKYYYDNLNQLTREDNAVKNETYVYEYDDAGNILSKKTYAFTTGTLGTATNTVNYTYGNSWGDLLTNYNGSAITYDIIGNPLAIGNINLSWQGRQLQMYSDWTYDITYTYNDDGIRTRKDLYEPGVGYTTRHEYIVSGSRIISEIVYLNMSYPENYVEQYRFIYIYDETGAPIGIKYRTPSYANGVFDCYFFEKNLQGDIVAIYNESGTKIGTYTYDAWGNCTVNPTSGYNFILSNNPFRYRGYYYDTETGYYYLQSRYYNPTWGRFLNADGYINANGDIIGFNMFAYCSNNPIKYTDPTGNVIGEAIGTGYLLYLLGKAALYSLGITASIAGVLTLGTMVQELDHDEVKEAEKVVTNPPPTNDDVYYGVKILGGEFKKITKDMNIDEITTWVYSVSPSMGKNTKWGVYAKTQSDALELLFRIISIDTPDFVGPVVSENHYSGTPVYNHFHTPYRIFNDKHKHFHIWYGDMIK